MVLSTSRKVRSTGSVAGPPSRSAAGCRFADEVGRAIARVGGVNAVDVLDDHEPACTERVGDEQRSRYPPGASGCARTAGGNLMRVVGWVGGADDTLCGREMDRQLATNHAVLDVGDAVVRE